MSAPLATWMRQQGWRVLRHQSATWSAAAHGESGLLLAPTGQGKSLAALGAGLAAAAAAPSGGPRILWITPLRALAQDLAPALAAPLAAIQPGWRVETRTGDTAAAARARQKTRLPEVLLTTPESASLLLSWPQTLAQLAQLRVVVVDEWHELLGNKRGVQTQLVLAALRHLAPGLQTWGLSATIGNPEQALAALLPVGGQGRIVRAQGRKALEIVPLLPADPGQITWAGHLGLNLLPQVVRAIEAVPTTLLFTNTRAQAELWYEALVAQPGWERQLALHHGSLGAADRAFAEAGLKTGKLRCVVATSSLDLGVDFAPVAQVIQVGSPRSLARLVQRAGRSGHAPGQPSRILCVPGHTLELAEFAAARSAWASGQIEPRPVADGGLDLLAQHVLTRCLGAPQQPDALRAELRSCHAYADLSEADWDWLLDFLGRGGEVLRAYPDYARLTHAADGRLCVDSVTVARRHRLQIGTIAADAQMRLQWVRGGTLGQVEEAFIARLKPGDSFLFGGRALELVRVHGQVAQVRRARGPRVSVPRWSGGRLPLSENLATAFVAQLAALGDAPEAAALQPLLDRQRAESALPSFAALLVESTRSREGWHLSLYPCAGRAVHEGLGALLAWRITRAASRSVTVAANDYGLELLSPKAWELDADALRRLLQPADALEDLQQALNGTELARRHFREIAQTAGLVFTGYPGRGKSARQVQLSTGLLHDVLHRYDPDNPLLAQTRREVLARELDAPRLVRTLQRLATLPICWQQPRRLTPFGFPLFVETQRQQLSSESLAERLVQWQRDWERGAA